MNLTMWKAQSAAAKTASLISGFQKLINKFYAIVASLEKAKEASNSKVNALNVKVQDEYDAQSSIDAEIAKVNRMIAKFGDLIGE